MYLIECRALIFLCVDLIYCYSVFFSRSRAGQAKMSDYGDDGYGGGGGGGGGGGKWT